MIVRPLIRELIRPSNRSLFQRGSGGFAPAQVFAGGAAGIWLDPSDISTGFQDSAGTTPQTGTGQPTGLRLDKSGNALNVLQAGAAARPEYTVATGIASDWMDGSDDGYATATFSAGTLTADMDCFIAINRASSAKGIVAKGDGISKVFGYYAAGEGGTAAQGAGSGVTHLVNGTAVPGGTGTTATQLNTAMTVGSWLVLEVRNLDLSAWTSFSVSLYPAYFVHADIGGVILCPAQSSSIRANIRRWLGNKVGLSL